MQNRIFSFDSPKAIKANAFGWVNAIHYLAPADVAGVGNLCGHNSPFCTKACLGWTSGQAAFVSDVLSRRTQGNVVRESRITKARRFMRDRANYMRDVVRSVELAQDRAKRLERKLCVRLNGSSDIAWESIKCERSGAQFPSVIVAFPDVQFVDYTKNPNRLRKALPSNYHLTLSRSETNEAHCLEALSSGHNVAVVFAAKHHGTRPQDWHGFPVIDGDKHDLRHLDPRGPRGVVVGLSPKGRVAKKDQSGFVVR